MSKTINIRPHARRQLEERNIAEDLVKGILSSPAQIVDTYNNRKVAQEIIPQTGGNNAHKL